MIENAVKRKLAQGLPVVGHWISLPSPSVVEIMAGFGMDWLLIDTEHGPASGERVEDLIRAMQGTSVTPFMRVARNDPALIKQALDRGAFGVLVPLVNTVDDARAAVAGAKYPPDGIRGVAGTRANRYGADLPEYFAAWNREVLVAVQIETAEAVRNVEAIAAVPGIDVLYIGPNDLSASLSQFRRFDAPEFRRAVDAILQAAKRAGVTAGYHTASVEEALERVEQGFRFVGLSTDARLLAAIMGTTWERLRQGLPSRAPR
ncbi:MAG TPA: aldolase/citrate lyase family protein [bacterium]